MELYTYLWDECPPLPASEEISEPSNNLYDHVQTSSLENYGLHAQIYNDHGENKDDHLYYSSNDTLSSMNSNGTPLEVSIDDYNICSNDDEIMFLYEIKAPSQPSHIYSYSNPTNTFDEGLEDQSFLDGVDDEIAQLCNQDTGNSTVENLSPVFQENNHRDANPDLISLNTHVQHSNGVDDHPNLHVTNALITTDAQGLPQRRSKRTRKPYEPKQKSPTNKVLKVVSAAELEADPWVWKKYGQKNLQILRGGLRQYYKCAYYATSEPEQCEAKKQVNKSCTDPNAYDVHYIGHHNHSTTHKSPPMRKRARNLKIKTEEECWSN